MRTITRAAALALALPLAATPAALAAQAAKADAPGNPVCGLVQVKEIDAATGLAYREGMDIDVLGEGIFGGATCLWGGASIAQEDMPQIGVVFIPPGPRGSYTEFWRKRKPEPDCTRETLRGIGDVAFAETCGGRLPRAKVYVKTGRNDLFVTVDRLEERPLAWAGPVARAVAKAAAPRARGL